MKKRLAILLSMGFIGISAQLGPADDFDNGKPLRIGKTSGGDDIITYVGVQTTFKGWAISPDRTIVRYEWDFDGDGVGDWRSKTTGIATHAFTRAGRYISTFKAYSDDGRELPLSQVRVIVREGPGKAVYIPREYSYVSDSAKLQTAGDGQEELYVLMINGGSERRYWEDVNYAYQVFTVDYNIPPEDIYFLNWDGTDPDGNNPDNMIDYSATIPNVQLACQQLSLIVDEDDLLYVFVTDHGRGYTGPNQYTSTKQAVYGYLDGLASVDPNDEEDYLESEFKLRALFTGGTYICNHGMNEWKVMYSSYGSATYYYRHQYVSYFSDVYFAEQGLVSDSDIYIEEFKDYLEGDLNKDGRISAGEVVDFDADGNNPYDHSTGTFDEDDWGQIDALIDNVRNINTGVPEGFQGTYWILDHGLDGCVDIDLDHDPSNPEINGTDVDNAGRFDGLDINDDKDMDDWVSIDEKICMYYYSDDMRDDQFKSCLEPINAKIMVVCMLPCFSGGFIEDLSADNRVIMTSCEEETVSYGNRFTRNIVSALAGRAYPDSAGDPSTADTNGDGVIDMVELFNFAAGNDYGGPIQMPQYDDNVDGVSQACPIPSAPICYGREGWLGNRVTLLGWDVWLSDFDADGVVDMKDLGEMCGEWLTGHSCLTDIAPQPEGDEIVNVLDFSVLAKEWQEGI
ncbi:MAG: hypothetical protein ACYTEL_02100 [Planctomycetota bacterium]